MRLAILNSSPHGNAADAKSNELLLACARWLGYRARVVEIAQLRLVPGKGVFGLAADEVVLPRADIRDSHDLWTVESALRALDAAGLRTLVSARGVALAEDKVQSFAAFAAAGLPVPASFALRAGPLPPGDLEALVEGIGGYPVVLKHPFGWGGMGVQKCADASALRAALTQAHQLRPAELLLVQHYVRHRCSLTIALVRGGYARAYRLFASHDEFRTNPRYGGPWEEARCDAALRALADQALTSCDLGHGSVDLLEAEDGSVQVAEVNSAPGLYPRDRGDRLFANAILEMALGKAPRRPAVQLVVPFALDANRGNSVSAARLRHALLQEGCDVPAPVVAAEQPQVPPELPAGIAVVHAIQAMRAGPLGAALAGAHGLPLVLSFRGTDLDELEGSGPGRDAVLATIARARVITVLTDAQRQRLEAVAPGAVGRIRVVPHGVVVPELVPAPAPALLVQIAGVRAEKGFPECLHLVDRTRELVPDLRYVLVGPVLDPNLDPAPWFAARSWARHAGAMPREATLQLLATAAVSLHASEREGLSNALLEALALGIPAVARETAAARAVITDGESGLLYATRESGARAIARVLGDSALVTRLRAGGHGRVRENFSAKAELEGYLAAYR